MKKIYFVFYLLTIVTSVRAGIYPQVLVDSGSSEEYYDAYTFKNTFANEHLLVILDATESNSLQSKVDTIISRYDLDGFFYLNLVIETRDSPSYAWYIALQFSHNQIAECDGIYGNDRRFGSTVVGMSETLRNGYNSKVEKSLLQNIDKFASQISSRSECH